MTRPRMKLDDLEWLHRQFASLARDTEGTKEGRRWKHVHDWCWAELERRRATGDKDEDEAQSNGKEAKP